MKEKSARQRQKRSALVGQLLERRYMLSADLRVDALESPASIHQNETIQVNFDVFNEGLSAASTDWKDAIYLSKDNNLDDGDIRLGSRSAKFQTPLVSMTCIASKLTAKLAALKACITSWQAVHPDAGQWTCTGNRYDAR